jgi:hypothetical protein
MSEQSKSRVRPAPNGVGGLFWFGGWLFTIAFARLVWWKAILGLVIWPYYIALVLR